MIVIVEDEVAGGEGGGLSMLVMYWDGRDGALFNM